MTMTRENPKYVDRNLSQCQFVQHKYYVDRSGNFLL